MIKSIIVLFIIYILFIHVHCRYLPQDNLPEETQHAICKIASKELEATANASITRQLRGVCSSDEMNTKLNQLEIKLLQEIDSIKYMLEVNGYVTPQPIEEMKISNGEIVPNYVNDLLNDVTVPQEKSSDEKQFVVKRRTEISNYNVSIQNSDLGKVFLYFWKICNFSDILERAPDYVSSDIFDLRGEMFINLYPYHLGTDYIALKLISKKHMEKYRFTILDGNDEKNDLTSQLLSESRNYAEIYRVSHNKIKNKYLVSGCLTTKLTIYLDL